MNMIMNEMTSNVNNERDEFVWDIKKFLRFFALEQRTDQQTDGEALWKLTVAEYDNEGNDE